MRTRTFIFQIILSLLGVSTAIGEDAYYNIPLQELTFTDGRLPAPPTPSWQNWRRRQGIQPYIILDQEGEAYLNYLQDLNQWGGTVAIRAPAGLDIQGRIFLPNSDWTGLVSLSFTVSSALAQENARDAFYQAKENHYVRLLQRNIPGAAWFRHQAQEAIFARTAKAAQEGLENLIVQNTQQWRRAGELEDTYAIFTGGRALSENLQLDRLLPPTSPGEEIVDISTLPGITVQEMDWQTLVKDLKPALDPLATYIPADQHAIFFPSFNAMTQMMDEADANGTPVLHWVESRSEDARTKERYESQLCLSMSDLARLLGPLVVESIALTGSDPYLRTGSDVAILFQVREPTLLTNFILAKHAEAMKSSPDVKAAKGEMNGIPYQGVVSTDRRISSYTVLLNKGETKVIIVTNSSDLLKYLIGVFQGTFPSLATLPEYTFFRNRYPIGEKEETAFLILTDATIRRLCSAQWRIASSRRTLVAAAMADLQAAHLNELAGGNVKTKILQTPLPIPEAGELRLTPAGVVSSVYGTLEFLTPIRELALSKVTQAEADAYNRWLNTYQQYWRQFFDPIMVRFHIESGKVAVDMTVMPLIEGTRYRQFINLSQGAQIEADDADPHANTLLHLAIAVNTSNLVQGALGFPLGYLAAMTPGLADPLGWLGESIAIYADHDPFWEELAKAEKIEAFMEEQYHRLPMALHFEIKNSLAFAAFFTAFRAFVEATAPGMTVWQTLFYNDQPYVKISPSAAAQAQRKTPEKWAVYYAATPESLVVTLNEDLLKRALDRRAQRQKASAHAWLGENLALQIDKKFLDIILTSARQEYQAAMQLRAWGNIPILNEWKRLYPDQDPVAFHEKFWQVKLVCPGGGNYQWNDKFQTMESSVYGHPSEPKEGPLMPPILATTRSGNFGLTFENQGLRARVEVEREETPNQH